MRCYRARRWLSTYLDDELDPGWREALETHLDSCEACSAELELYKHHWASLAEGVQAPALPANLWGQILSSLDESERLPWHRRYRARLLQVACVTACVLLGFAGGAHLSWKQPPAVDASERVSMSERMMIAEAFDVTAFGLSEGKEGLLRCVPK